MSSVFVYEVWHSALYKDNILSLYPSFPNNRQNNRSLYFLLTILLFLSFPTYKSRFLKSIYKQGKIGIPDSVSFQGIPLFLYLYYSICRKFYNMQCISKVYNGGFIFYFWIKIQCLKK